MVILKTKFSSKLVCLLQLFDNKSSSYTYLLADINNKEAVIIDPVLKQAERDAQIIKDLGLTLKYASKYITLIFN